MGICGRTGKVPKIQFLAVGQMFLAFSGKFLEDYRCKIAGRPINRGVRDIGEMPKILDLAERQMFLAF